ncbi:phospholipid carrier-dependent glycosyltransferase [Tychonema sp. LEGE 07199]|uniref:dolichyl-phosphate-mannose--protein mannosyltransferase n=1 Tax=unclassified Tychonema TaxID=2642144 RepID=UPI00187E52F4|nr:MULTISPECIES: phospholipid carrier-dependent glycosyltransferase [unclassified Tychonema]MBE9123178.1 phospholipid carrier-dependent glycosyltransferase [Tychonema sp. LEGE 07199]MBE9134547.1 phospholipid carrier-dependent glycosyltransferase [Tychonema sp. LEGE 07196]
MQANKKQFNRYTVIFYLGMFAVFLLSLTLRFWQLERFNTLVFDEVYYAKFANDYLTKTPFFNAHPPLSQYIIAIGIAIGTHLPFGKTAVNGLTGSMLSPWDYRWLNALTGSFIPLVVGALAYQLLRRRTFAFLAALFIACDGLFLVESRYALNNIYLVLFGILGQLFLLKTVEAEGKKRLLWLVLAGIGFGASAAVKWNGLWFLFGAYLILICAWAVRLIQGNRGNEEPISDINSALLPPESPVQKLTQLTFVEVCWSLAVIPILVYSICWIPHLHLNPTPNFWQMQTEILTYHERIKSGPSVHPYCSTWYSWPLMLRPIVYFYKTASNNGQPDPVLPPLPSGATETIFDVHAMGNPFLWWFSTLALILVAGVLIHRIVVWFQTRQVASVDSLEQQQPILFPPTAQMWMLLYLIVNWAANLLPWMKVSRCVFLYHYMGCSVFGALTLAWWVDRWLHSPQTRLRGMGVTIVFLVLAAFIFWMPIYLGLPLSQGEWNLRMWLRSWV